VIYPALDLSTLSSARGEIAKRASDLAAISPLLYGDRRNVNLAARQKWEPYLVTYLREAYDRGYPLIRPLPVQFSRDKNLDPQPGVFMLGDEVLLAPVVAPGSHQHLQLLAACGPTCARTSNIKGIKPSTSKLRQDRCRRSPATVRFCRSRQRTQWSCTTSLRSAASFFYGSPTSVTTRNFHAAPAGDFIRVEIESKSRGPMNG